MIQLTPVVCVFARAPVEGSVKRRLAADIGDTAALRAHAQLARHTVERIRPVTDRGLLAELWIQGDPGYAQCREWAGLLGGRLRQQQGEDLGASMWHTAHTHLKFNRHVLIVGADVVSIDADYICEAAARLEDVDVVLGPAEDGGYGLIGLSRPAPDLFRGIPWGTSEVLARTLDRIATAGWSVQELPLLWDVDTKADWERFKAAFPEPPFRVEPALPFTLVESMAADRSEDPQPDSGPGLREG